MTKLRLKLLMSICILIFITMLPAVKSYAGEITVYDIGKGNVVISKSGDYKITGSTKAYTLIVNQGVSANITLSNASIISNKVKVSPIQIKNGGAANFVLTGTNTITSKEHGAAIHVPQGARFIISAKSKGTLTATGGFGGAGIGGNCFYGENNGTGTITIKGGTVNAAGGMMGCGIGGGISDRSFDSIPEYNCGAGTIIISGGKVTAIGGLYSSAGIGGSSIEKQGKITISGGEVNASSLWGAGIGGENKEGKGNIIAITGGVVNATGNSCAPGIGNSLNAQGTVVNISGGTIKAQGDYGNRQIESYVIDWNKETKDTLTTYDIAAEKIVIDGGNVMAFTNSSQPLNKAGKKVYQGLFNCEKAQITSIRAAGTAYGVKDMVSAGYLSLYLPEKVTVEIKSGNKSLFRQYFYGGSYELFRNSELFQEESLDIGKGDIEIIPGGVIYQNQVYRMNRYVITGTTATNRITVHKSRDPVQLVWKDLKADLMTTTQADFLNVRSECRVNIHLKGENSIRLGDGKNGIYVGRSASLCFTGEGKDSLSVDTGTGSNGIFTNFGDVLSYGGSLTFQMGAQGSAVRLGNLGTFSLYGGVVTAKGEEVLSITGMNHTKVNVYGGLLKVGSIGVIENGNEEIYNDTRLDITGGRIEASGRVIFGTINIYGGEIKSRILGCGTSCVITMYDGVVETGATAERIVTGEYTYSNFTWLLYGGNFINRQDVPLEELDRIDRHTS